MTDEAYNGWTNRETWAVALWINNEQGWQESLLDELRAAVERAAEKESDDYKLPAWRAGEIVKENVEEMLLGDEYALDAIWQRDTLHDIGSLYRVNWDELGASFLSDVAEASE